ncbi:Na+/H+ antiporter NhaC family protein [Tuberibacillus sp. Marseille-P3662]|uniref:Na+/H+ antiporter NhaC family protein n=1 Tax=Tuberibacillus sp. Marseille-P3662 TaxID=1965358 RepID=UPI000A1CDDBE|nr:Na+/H+ antiporter NhaC family protein [Tuberibacillus sp. Marseille-P3662]
MDTASWLSLLPFLIVIPVSILTKQVQPGLFVALLLGSYLVDPSLLGGIQQFISYIVDNTVKSSNIRIIIFLYGFAGLINLIKMAGGIKGFVDLVSHKVKTKKSALGLTWLTTIGTFSDPDFRIVTITPIMKALRKRLNMSKRRIGIVIEVTSNPIVALVPIATAFVGYMVQVINSSLQNAGINQGAYVTYVKSIPFNFFSFVIVLVGIYYTFFVHPKGEKDHQFEGTAPDDVQSSKASSEGAPEKQSKPDHTVEHAEESAVNPSDLHQVPSSNNVSQINQKKYNEEYARHPEAADNHIQADKLDHSNDQQQQENEQKSHDENDDTPPSRPWNLLLPLGIMLILTLFLSWWDGHFKAQSFLQSFIKVDALGVMLEALLIAIIFAVILVMFQKFKVSKIVTHFIEGGNQLMSVIVLLALIWGLSAASEDLGFSDYVTAHVQGWIPTMLIPPVIFVLGALISYFIGSSWGTWGLLMPLGVMLGHQADANILLVIGAVFASGTFGAFASPLSDNTVTLCTILDLPVVDYAKSKLVPALIAAGITAVLFTGAAFIL